MPRPKIVFADNDNVFLKERRAALEKVGLEVIAVTTPDGARAALAKPDIDLAILDVRLEDDEDNKDISGLLLAAEDTFKNTPKIILTVHNNEKELLETLAVQGGKLPIYLDFIYKGDGSEAMLAAVTRALAAASLARNRERDHSLAAPAASREVFLIHGHDENAKLEVTVFIYKLRLEPVILGEMTTDGRTIMEMIDEKGGGVGFAIAILTPDDFGGCKKEPEIVNDRARQNVIFEMGFFMGRLGRTKVRALCKVGVEILSDYDGVLYISMDSSGGWRFQLAKELKSAGYEIDLNLVMH